MWLGDTIAARFQIVAFTNYSTSFRTVRLGIIDIQDQLRNAVGSNQMSLLSGPSGVWRYCLIYFPVELRSEIHHMIAFLLLCQL